MTLTLHVLTAPIREAIEPVREQQGTLLDSISITRWCGVRTVIPTNLVSIGFCNAKIWQDSEHLQFFGDYRKLAGWLNDSLFVIVIHGFILLLF